MIDWFMGVGGLACGGIRGSVALAGHGGAYDRDDVQGVSDTFKLRFQRRVFLRCSEAIAPTVNEWRASGVLPGVSIANASVAVMRSGMFRKNRQDLMPGFPENDFRLLRFRQFVAIGKTPANFLASENTLCARDCFSVSGVARGENREWFHFFSFLVFGVIFQRLAARSRLESPTTKSPPSHSRCVPSASKISKLVLSFLRPRTFLAADSADVCVV